jgi:eukaryotic-like serine/threonine-protein kinase
MTQPTAGFRGTERYQVRRVLGAGGMGVVYEVYDRRRKTTVALKTLRRLDAASIYRFKREFRAVARASHPNLVKLYELVAEDEQCFFTMELVDGVDLLRWVGHTTWPGAETASGPPSLDDVALPTPEVLERSDAPADATAPRARALPARVRPAATTAGLDEGRLRGAMRQLAQGVMALHQMGCLHRDIKPSNVLVAPDGRVVLLDLGLVTSTHPSEASVERYVAGTAAYMSPEQASAKPLTEASDWYSVGVVLYEALTGARPFRGVFEHVLREKIAREPAPPSSVAEGVPEDLEELCVELLRIEPSERPKGAEILRLLGDAPPAGASDPPPPPSVSIPAPGAAFVGRREQLGLLAGAYRAASEGRTTTVHVHGSSGMGKSALLRHFLDDVSVGRDAAVVLTGRCYQRESVPFKAVDGLIDSLSRHLRAMPRARVDALLPEGTASLSRVFPVLEQVEAVALVADPRPQAADPHELRRRAFAALRRLLARIAAQRPLVLCVDDLQWGDLDSVHLLAELTRPPDAPAMLLIVSYRGDEIGSCPHVDALREVQGLGSADVALGVTEIPVGALDKADATELAGRLLGGEATDRERQASTVAAESGGNPFFVHELVRWVQREEIELSRLAERSDEGRRIPGPVRLESVLASRLDQLSTEARTVLETVALAGRPLSRQVLTLATDLGPAEHKAVDDLRATCLLRVRASAGEEAVEPYHDRIRQVLVRGLPGWQVRERHLRLALALQGTRHADPEALAEHYCGAGHLEKAGEFALLAADQAAEAVAFDRTAMLLRFAMRMLDDGIVARQGLRPRLADALAQAGRSSEAAQVFMECVGETQGQEALQFQARAAEEHLRAGQLEEGMAVLAEVLAALKMKMAGSQAAAMRSLVGRRLRLRLRGLGWRERDPATIAPVDRMRADICWAVSSGLAMIDPIRGGDYQTRGLLLALQSGDPHQVARFLAGEAGYSATSGPRGRERSAAILKDAAGLAERLGDPKLRGLVAFGAAVSAYEGGDWRRAREMAERAERLYLDYCSGVTLELATNRHFLLLALLQLGELAEMAVRAPAYTQDAEARGDRFTSTSFRNGCMNITWLVRDDVAGARRAVETAMKPWRQREFLLQHYEGLYAAATIDLYAGEPAAAWEQITEAWPRLASAQLLRVQQLHLEVLYLRGRTALAIAASEPQRRGAMLAEARSASRRMLKERMAWAEPLARLIEAGAAAVEGRTAQAVSLLEQLVPALDLQDMGLYAAAARRRLGELRGDAAGALSIQQVDDWFVAQGVRNAAAMTALFAPGFPERP